jgi:hypothetical protein
MFEYRCTNGGKQHNFKARYSVVRNGIDMDGFMGSVGAYKNIIESMKDEIYKGDVCTWCGKIINEPED